MIELCTTSLAEIGAHRFSQLLGPDPLPFLRYEWLDALERTGAVAPRTGWAPAHLALRRGGELVAFAPAYVKAHSQGEFVFDHAIAQFSESRLGVPYYPKLVLGVPFTPATGPRLLVRPGEDEAELCHALGRGLAQACEELEVSSAHVLFPTEQQCGQLVAGGMVERLGLQFQFRNPGYDSFEQFLSCFSSKRRHQLRRERRLLAEAGLTLETRSGGELDEALVDLVFDCYRNTVERYTWGRQYLGRGFFHEVVRAMPDGISVVIARRQGRPIASAFNLVGGGAMFGRYWGALEEHPYLHFNVCYYEGIAEVIARKLTRFEPGAGGEHKRARGFMPTATRSAHFFVHSTVAEVATDFFVREARAIAEHIAAEPPVLRPQGAAVSPK